MSDSIKRQAQIMRYGAIAAPVLAVVLIRYAGPQQSIAATPVKAYEIPVLPSARVSDDEPAGLLGAAAEYAKRLFETGISGNPFPEPEALGTSSDTPPMPAVRSAEQLAQPEPGVPDLRISAVMSRRGGAIAVINSRICVVGARVAPDWTLDAVDQQSRTLVIRHTGGRRVELALSTP